MITRKVLLLEVLLLDENTEAVAVATPPVMDDSLRALPCLWSSTVCVRAVCVCVCVFVRGGRYRVGDGGTKKNYTEVLEKK